MSFHPRRPKILDTKPRVCFFLHSAFTTSFTFLTGGVFLNGLALLMGAGDLLSSYLSVILNVCGVLILAFSALLERVQSRKRLTVTLTALSRLATLFIVLIPLIFPESVRLAAFVVAVVVAFTLQAQTTVALNQWMLHFMDEAKKGRYISLRQTLILIVTVALSLAGGRFMDFMNGQYLGFILLFAAAAVMGLLEILLLVLTPDAPSYCPKREKRGFLEAVKLPLRDRKFVGFVLSIVLFYLLLNLSDSFTMVYLQKYLALPYQTVTLLYMLISLPQIFLLGLFGRLGDKKGAKFVLNLSIWLFAGETLFLFFTSPSNWFIFIPAAFLTAAVGNAGFVTASFNRRYELMPKDRRIPFDNFYSAAVGLAFILGPLVGSAFKGIIETTPVLSTALPFANIRLLYLISTAALLLFQIVRLFMRRKADRPTVIAGSDAEGYRLEIPYRRGRRTEGTLVTASGETRKVGILWSRRTAFSLYPLDGDCTATRDLIASGHYTGLKDGEISLHFDSGELCKTDSSHAECPQNNPCCLPCI